MQRGEAVLLNRAARFFPILRVLRSRVPAGGTLLEVGSGSLGLGEYWAGPFVGCDVSFSSRPVNNMLPVVCSGHQLPFRDGSFDAVVVSDVMEHVLPQQRKQVVEEVLRVARTLVVFGYPCGRAAFAVDEKLHRDYRSRNLAAPAWLEEHMLHSFPDEDLLQDLPDGWKSEVMANENLRFHYWMMKAEMSHCWNYLLRVALRIVPEFVECLLREANREPSYRKIFVLTRGLKKAHG
jgi:hypothetical protein